jgi:heparosan-N-sulfate-glucuronate 5-epimerase
MMNISTELTKEDLLGQVFCNSKYAIKYPLYHDRDLDENGVLIYKIPYGNHFRYYPVHLARYGLGNLEKYVETNDKQYYNAFLAQADWLFDNLIEKNNFAVWDLDYTVPFYEIDHVPWRHGLGQVLGMMVLLKASQFNQERDYLKKAELVLNSFDATIEDGGVKNIDKDDNVWFEEYALNPPPHVLNGFITILFGLHEFHRETKHDLAIKLFNKGVSTLEENIESFDANYWSYYDLLRKVPATMSYHKMHVWQLDLIFDLTGIELFKEKSKRWQSFYNKKVNKIRAKMMRNVFFLKKYGITGSVKRFNERREWKKS